jgi:hypothetical protein
MIVFHDSSHTEMATKFHFLRGRGITLIYILDEICAHKPSALIMAEIL